MIAIDMKLITIDSLLIQKCTQLFSFIFFVFFFTHNAIFSPTSQSLQTTWYFQLIRKKESVRLCSAARQTSGIAKHLERNGRRNNILTLLDMYDKDERNPPGYIHHDTYEYRMSVTLSLSFFLEIGDFDV